MNYVTATSMFFMQPTYSRLPTADYVPHVLPDNEVPLAPPGAIIKIRRKDEKHHAIIIQEPSREEKRKKVRLAFPLSYSDHCSSTAQVMISACYAIVTMIIGDLVRVGFQSAPSSAIPCSSTKGQAASAASKAADLRPTSAAPQSGKASLWADHSLRPKLASPAEDRRDRTRRARAGSIGILQELKKTLNEMPQKNFFWESSKLNYQKRQQF